MRLLFKKDLFFSIYKPMLAIITGFLYWLALPEHNYFILSLFVYVPILYAIRNTGLLAGYGLSLIAGMTMVMLCCPWMLDVSQSFFGLVFPWNIVVFVESAFIGAQPLAISLLLYRWLSAKFVRYQLWLLPLSVITVFSFFTPLLQSLLAYGFSNQLWLIQTVDITGVLGLEFIILTINSLVFYFMVTPTNQINRRLVMTVFSLLALWLSYSSIRLNNINQQLGEMRTVSFAIAQPYRKPTTDARYTNKIGQTDLWEFNQYNKIDASDIDLMIWPEGTFYGYQYIQETTQNLQKMVKDKGLPLIFQDDYYHPFKPTAENRVYLLNAAGELKGQYTKRKLMPFGEQLDTFGYNYLLEWLEINKVNYLAGTQAAYFNIKGINYVPLICFESFDATLVANTFNSHHQSKVAVLLSQDGWYGDSLQQVNAHRAITQFRAIENKIPFIHVINNGPSQVISVTGESSFNSPHLFRGIWKSQVKVARDNIYTFYKRYPGWFELVLKLILGGFIFTALVVKIHNKRSRN